MQVATNINVSADRLVRTEAGAGGTDPALRSNRSMSEDDPDGKNSSVDCPSCDRTFPSARSMKGHHVQVHGESIAGVEKTCETCGDSFRVRPSRATSARFCSDACKYGTEFYCLVPCSNCGVEVPKQRWYLESHDNQFCSQACYGEWRGETFVGEAHPQWTGGEFTYGPGWTESKKEAVRERDGHRCQRCGMDSDTHLATYGRKLDVHHIVPAREIDDPEERHSMENLVTLCQSCHPLIEQSSSEAINGEVAD